MPNKLLKVFVLLHPSVHAFQWSGFAVTNIYIGGSDTVRPTQISQHIDTLSDVFTFKTLSAIQTFFLAMALYPEIQRKAQAELDAMIGNSRLPTFQDRDSLPYVNALIKETLRWQNATPSGMPPGLYWWLSFILAIIGVGHMSMQDDVYEGYFIPKGTIVIGNTWWPGYPLEYVSTRGSYDLCGFRSFMHDESVYQDPLEFIPDRYLKNGKLDPSVRDPKVAVFGFGRR